MEVALILSSPELIPAVILQSCVTVRKVMLARVHAPLDLFIFHYFLYRWSHTQQEPFCTFGKGF